VVDELPEAWQGSGNVAANYHAATVEDLLALIGSDEVANAVADGVTWFGRFNELDGTDFTGNIYEPTDTVGREPAADSAFVAERFEVPEADAQEFDAWLSAHLLAVGRAAGVVRARSFRAVRSRSPIPFYDSPGNRAVVAELEDLSCVLEPDLRATLADSLQWDLRFRYVKRDAYRCVFSIDS
jgi:hypothetical protein